MTELKVRRTLTEASGSQLGSPARSRENLPHWVKLAIAAAALFAVGGVAAPSMMHADAILSMAPFAAILALASIGQHLVIQQRGFDLSVAGAISLASAIVTVLPDPHASFFGTAACVLLALFVGVLGGLVNGLTVALVGVPPLVATIGVNAILIALTLVISAGSPHTAPTLLSALAQGRPLGVPNTALFVLIFAALVGLVIQRTPLGRRFVALSVSPRAAAASGVPVNLYRIFTFVLAGFCFAAAGVLMAGFLQVPGVTAGDGYMLPTVAAVVIGGNASLDRRSSIAATIIGAVVLTYVGQLVISLGFEQSVQYVVQAIIVLASVSLPDATRWLRVRAMDLPVTSSDGAPISMGAVALGGLAREGRSACAPVLELRGIHKSFGPVHALRNVSLRFFPGEVHAVVGENGAGKSTLLGIAAGTLRADGGEILRDGKPLVGHDIAAMRASGVSVAYQHPALAPDLTVLENIKLFSTACESATAERLIRSIALKHLQTAVNRRVADLSLAQRHVVEIARALATSPRVLFLDEPTEPFQKADVERLFELVKELKAGGVAVVYVSHRLHEVMAIADRVSVLRDGVLVDTRLRDQITNSEIVTLVAGKPLAQIFPGKGQAAGAVVLEAKGLSGPGFSNVDLVAHSGEIIGLTGVEGQGQREFVRALAGLNRRDRGEVLVRGVSVGADPGSARRASIGFITDDRHAEGVFAGLTIRENIGFTAFSEFSSYGLINMAEEARVSRKVAADFEVKAASIETLVANLSGGNQQKVLFGREVLASPSVLLVDEPTKGIDIGTRSEIYRRLRQISNSGAAVIVSSSDGVEIEGLCDRVIIFARGAAVKELAGAEIDDTAITEANMTVTTLRDASEPAARRRHVWRDMLSGDYFPGVVLGLMAIVVAAVINHLNPYFLTAFNMGNLLTMTAMLACITAGQLCAILVGGIDLSVGPLAGLGVVLASFLLPSGAEPIAIVGGAALIVLACGLYGLLQAGLIIALRLPSVVVTLASFIGLQGVSLLLRPQPAGMIDSGMGDLFSFPLAGVPAAMAFVIAGSFGLEWLLRRSRVGRGLRAMGSAESAAQKLGVSRGRAVAIAFGASGLLTGVGSLMLAAQIGIGSPITGIDFTLMSITAVVLGGSSISGGRGSFLCSLMGAAMVQLMVGASTFLQAGPAWQYGLVGITTVIAASLFSVARPRNTYA